MHLKTRRDMATIVSLRVFHFYENETIEALNRIYTMFHILAFKVE